MVVLHLACEQANKGLAKRSRFPLPLLRARPWSLAISPKWRVRELIKAWSLDQREGVGGGGGVADWRVCSSKGNGFTFVRTSKSSCLTILRVGLGKILVTVASVSARVVEKIGREAGAKRRNRGAGEFPISPFPSTLLNFFASLQLSRNNSIRDACQAG